MERKRKREREIKKTGENSCKYEIWKKTTIASGSKEI